MLTRIGRRHSQEATLISELKSSPSSPKLLQPLSCLAPDSSISPSPSLNPQGIGTYRDDPLQTDVEVLPLIGLQFLEGESGLTNKLIMAEFVLITDRDSVVNIKDGDFKKRACIEHLLCTKSCD